MNKLFFITSLNDNYNILQKILTTHSQIWQSLVSFYSSWSTLQSLKIAYHQNNSVTYCCSNKTNIASDRLLRLATIFFYSLNVIVFLLMKVWKTLFQFLTYSSLLRSTVITSLNLTVHFVKHYFDGHVTNLIDTKFIDKTIYSKTVYFFVTSNRVVHC